MSERTSLTEMALTVARTVEELRLKEIADRALAEVVANALAAQYGVTNVWPSRAVL